MTTDVASHGSPFIIGRTIVAVLSAEPGLSGATILDNPVRAQDLSMGPRLIWIEDQADKPIGNAGQRAQRAYSFALGVIARTPSARADAHASYRMAKRAIRQTALQQMTEAGVTIVGAGLLELEVSYRIENIDVGGGLVLGLFSVDYRDPSNT